MSLFNTNRYMNRQTVAQNVSRWLDKTAQAVATMDNSNRIMAEQFEESCAKLINDDEDVQMILRKIGNKFGINAQLMIVPRFNNATLIIENYALCLPNVEGKLQPVIVKANMKEMYDYLLQVAVSGDDALLNQFYNAVVKIPAVPVR